jgi:hypothetical protein
VTREQAPDHILALRMRFEQRRMHHHARR